MNHSVFLAQSSVSFSATIKQGRKRTVNVSCFGQPFGQLWTWANTRTERHPWHAKRLGGEHRTFVTVSAAKAWMRSQA